MIKNSSHVGVCVIKLLGISPSASLCITATPVLDLTYLLISSIMSISKPARSQVQGSITSFHLTILIMCLRTRPVGTLWSSLTWVQVIVRLLVVVGISYFGIPTFTYGSGTGCAAAGLAWPCGIASVLWQVVNLSVVLKKANMRNGSLCDPLGATCYPKLACCLAFCVGYFLRTLLREISLLDAWLWHWMLSSPTC